MLHHEHHVEGFQLHLCPEPCSTRSTFQTARSRNTWSIISMFGSVFYLLTQCLGLKVILDKPPTVALVCLEAFHGGV